LESDFDALFANFDKNADGKVSWPEFRDKLNNWEWRMTERSALEEKVESIYKQAYKLRMQGNDKESKDLLTKALRLQGSLTKTEPIEPPPPIPDTMPHRGDFFHLKVLRKDPGQTLNDKSQTYKFNK
jgi:hypothetical protein